MTATDDVLMLLDGCPVWSARTTDPRLVTALHSLALALHELRRWVEGEGLREDARTAALRAAGAASELLTGPLPLTASVLVGQLRSAAVDVLRATGLDQHSAVHRLEAAAGPADRPDT
ncbi:hypothetical protein GL263_08090 [Streptomyces durbertensis]|uniref:Uncharacterized protein n=1 Tax=Streptomyces durbertensis TaxID=2448886 RepID=A0ABR6EDW4_9ACTN|nr:hypothetical protein [Streptomyces durbertensis]MBB1243520.1 hypothetical protein [Streptomyces durbertensis]